MCFASAKNSQRSTTRPSAALATASPAATTPIDAADEQRDQGQQRRQRKAGEPRDAAQPGAVLAGDAEAHLLQQIILLGMRRLRACRTRPRLPSAVALATVLGAEVVSIKRQ